MPLSDPHSTLPFPSAFFALCGVRCAIHRFNPHFLVSVVPSTNRGQVSVYEVSSMSMPLCSSIVHLLALHTDHSCTNNNKMGLLTTLFNVATCPFLTLDGYRWVPSTFDSSCTAEEKGSTPAVLLLCSCTGFTATSCSAACGSDSLFRPKFLSDVSGTQGGGEEELHGRLAVLLLCCCTGFTGISGSAV